MVASSTRLHVHPQFARDDPAHVEQVFDQLGLRPGAAADDFQRLGGFLRAHATGGQQVDPAEDHVERRAQLVRQGGQEFVFDVADALGFGPGGAFGGQQAFAFDFGPFVGGDVADDFGGAGHVSVGVAQGKDGQRDVDRAAVFGQPQRLRNVRRDRRAAAARADRPVRPRRRGGRAATAAGRWLRAGAKPNSRSAPAFQVVIMPSSVWLMIASFDDSTMAISLARAASASRCSVRSSTNRTIWPASSMRASADQHRHPAAVLADVFFLVGGTFAGRGALRPWPARCGRHTRGRKWRPAGSRRLRGPRGGSRSIAKRRRWPRSAGPRNRRTRCRSRSSRRHGAAAALAAPAPPWPWRARLASSPHGVEQQPQQQQIEAGQADEVDPVELLGRRRPSAGSFSSRFSSWAFISATIVLGPPRELERQLRRRSDSWPPRGCRPGAARSRPPDRPSCHRPPAAAPSAVRAARPNRRRSIRPLGSVVCRSRRGAC